MISQSPDYFACSTANSNGNSRTTSATVSSGSG